MEFYTTIQIPEIAVTPAPYEKPIEEPASPFSWATLKLEDDDGFRQQHLTPPPTGSHSRGRQLSPLRPSDSPVTGKGLERERFEAMLKASRERNAAVGSKKPTALRKEIALKQHKSKQLERRMLFLSKLQAPPSPTATLLPKTPPESPALFHYTLPSPGLESPLAVFEQLASENPARISSDSWVEQVYFRLPNDEPKSAKKSPAMLSPAPTSARKGASKRLPSLDQITARMSIQGQLPVTPIARVQRPASSRLPAFLRSSPAKEETPLSKLTPSLTSAPKRPSLVSVGRLQLPNKASSSPVPSLTISAPIPVKSEISPLIPSTPVSPKLEVTVTLVPRSASSSPSDLSESNLNALDSKTTQRKDMLSVIKRRTSSGYVIGKGVGHGLNSAELRELAQRRLKRNSAPPELQNLHRGGFQHPVLALPGGF